MRSLTRWFLRAKHWQIFLLLIVTYVVAEAASFGMELKLGPVGSWANFYRPVLLTEAAWAPFVFCVFGWIASVGFFLNSALEPELKLRTGFFRFALVYALLYLFAGPPLFLRIDVAAWVVIPLHLFALFCIVYALNFVAKALKTTELQRPTVMHEYGKELLLLMFIPIGIWWIQPRINRLYASAQNRVV